MDHVPTQPDLANFILAEVQRQTSEDALRKLVETKIGDCVKSAVDSAMRSYGNVGKQIEKAVEESLSIQGRTLDVPAYGVMVMAVLRAKMDETLGDLINDRLASEMESILRIAPKELKLSAVVKAMTDQLDQGERYGTCITMIVEESEYSDGYHHIHLDEEADKRKYDCELQLSVDPEGRIYSLKCGGRDAKNTIIMGSLYDYKKMVFAAYASGSKFIVDESHCSTGIGDF